MELSKGKENISINSADVKVLLNKGKKIIKSDNKKKLFVFSKFSIKTISAIAALLIIVIGSILYIGSPKELINRNDLNNIRGVDKYKVKLISPIGSYKKKELEFKWHSIKGAKGYISKLYNEELSCICTSQKMIMINSIYPSNLFSKIEKGKTDFWKLIVYLKNGEEIKSKFKNFEKFSAISSKKSG